MKVNNFLTMEEFMFFIIEASVIPGYAISGTVYQIGKQVKGFSVGDEVVGLCPFNGIGGCAQYTVQSWVNLGMFKIFEKPLSNSNLS